jgi:sugar-specific transcriptional regulator TrmB
MAPYDEAMENGQGHVEQLTRLGLTMYEAKAYLALIRRGSSTAAEVARIAGVPRQRIYDVLASLVERGLASTRPGRVVNYVASPPDTAIERLVSDHKQAVEELERGANVMIRQLAPAFKEGQGVTDPLDYIEVLRDRRAINERFSELQDEIKDEILVFTKPPYATPPQEEEKGLEVTATHTARSVYEFSIFDDPATIEGVRRFIDAGEEGRFVEQLPLKLVIIDERYVMFGMEDPVAGGSELTMVVVEHHALATTLKGAFETIWSQGLSFDEAHKRFASAPDAPSPLRRRSSR